MAPAVDVEREGESVAVRVGGEPFTAYRHGDPELAKPVLFPVVAPSGDPVTRGYPLDPRPEDRRDHPHQVGVWLAYGDVNGIDFWNASDETPAWRDDVGTIAHRGIEGVESGDGAFAVRCVWERPDGSALLEEATRYAVRARPGVRVIDRATALTAVDGPVTFGDDKEGLFGLRVARRLERPVEEDLVFTDTAGEETVVRATGDHEVTGTYRSSAGGTEWGSRAAWMALSGALSGGEVTVAILDHPGNPGFPTRWMARPYGLFAANPLGRAAFAPDAEPRSFAVSPDGSATFRYRLFVAEGVTSRERLDAEHDRFADAAPAPPTGG
ncbi:MAG: PmoA family protein [Halobacteriales archaeon]